MAYEGLRARLGTSIVVQSRFDGAWCRGFELAEVVETEEQARVRVRRVSDGVILPALFAPDEISFHDP
jgi:hypothetical protein